MIGADAYCAVCKLKRTPVFVIPMSNLEFQVAKKARLKTDPKSVILKKYYDLLDVFLKKDSDILFLYQKYDHKIILKKEKKYSYT